MKKIALIVWITVVTLGLAQAGTVTAEWHSWDGQWQDNDTVYTMQADVLTTDPTLQNPVAEAYLYTVDVAGNDYPNEQMPTIWDEYQGRDNVVVLGANDQLYFELDNYPGGDYKELLLTITYYNNGVYADILPVEPQADAVNWLREDSFVDNWITETFQIIYIPNPAWEAVGINFVDATGNSAYPAYIDSVVISTECIPEPATIGLLSLGGMLLKLRRKR